MNGIPMNKIKAQSEVETGDFARNLAKNLKNGGVLCIFGGLGVGKTVFSREIVRFLTKNENLEVPSPTFTLVQSYDADICELFHFDLYRLDDPEEVFELGWEDALADGISIIEWPEKAGAFLPTRYTAVRISIDSDHENARHIEIEEIGI